jgi:hypothetical protein
MPSRLAMIGVVAISLILSGCPKTVVLTVRNQLPTTPPPPNLNISAVATDDKGQQTGVTQLGTAGPNQTVNGTFKVEQGGSYSVKADLSSGVNVFKGGAKTINDDTTDSVDITKLDAAIIDPSDISAIQATFGQLGPQIGFNPITLKSGLGSVFGGLVWYVDTTTQTAETQPVSVVPPSLLTGAVDYATFPWPSAHDTKTSTISTDASVKAGGSVPLWGSLSVNFSSNSIYKMQWSITDFGNVQKTDTVSVPDKLNSLTAAQKQDICKRLTVTDSYVMYVNQMYVVRSVNLDYQQGSSLSAGASLSGGSVVTASGAYDFSSSQTQSAQVTEVIVNIFGPKWKKTDLSFCTGADFQALWSLPSAVPTGFARGSLQDLEHPSVVFKKE